MNSPSVRALFAEATLDEALKDRGSGKLHLIVFDEFDALVKPRGQVGLGFAGDFTVQFSPQLLSDDFDAGQGNAQCDAIPTSVTYLERRRQCDEACVHEHVRF
eukprot:9467831-Pyramimonas_sp.AAC.1